MQQQKSRETTFSVCYYILSRRIANTAFEMIHSQQNILEIATKYGFSNPDSFQWWKNKDTHAVFSFGERFTVKTVVENAIEIMTPRKCGEYAKAGYAWKKAVLDENQFKKEMVSTLLVERLMCQGDAMDCLADGRKNACQYFKTLAAQNPKQPLLELIAEQLAASAAGAHKMYEVLGGCERGEKQMQSLASREVRIQIDKRTKRHSVYCKSC